MIPARVEREAEQADVEEIAGIDPLTARAIGLGLLREEHWDDPRWRTLAEKHLR